MGLLWGNDTKTCPECGMEIPSSAKTCPYCHRKFQDSLMSDVHQFGCLGYPLILLFLLGIFWLLSQCS